MVTRKPTRRRPARATADRPRAAASIAADPFPALADPTRRAILDGLRSAPRTAGDIASDFAISRPGVSKHLRILTTAGLVRVVKHGRERHYHLDASPLSQVDAWVARYRMFWASTLLNLKDHAEALAAQERSAAPGNSTPEGSAQPLPPERADAARDPTPEPQPPRPQQNSSEHRAS